jgi:hypothetical protein
MLKKQYIYIYRERDIYFNLPCVGLCVIMAMLDVY